MRQVWFLILLHEVQWACYGIYFKQSHYKNYNTFFITDEKLNVKLNQSIWLHLTEFNQFFVYSYWFLLYGRTKFSVVCFTLYFVLQLHVCIKKITSRTKYKYTIFDTKIRKAIIISNVFINRLWIDFVLQKQFANDQLLFSKWYFKTHKPSSNRNFSLQCFV